MSKGIDTITFCGTRQSDSNYIALWIICGNVKALVSAFASLCCLVFLVEQGQDIVRLKSFVFVFFRITGLKLYRGLQVFLSNTCVLLAGALGGIDCITENGAW